MQNKAIVVCALILHVIQGASSACLGCKAGCSVSLQAYGNEDTGNKTSYIIIKDIEFWAPYVVDNGNGFRGFNCMILDTDDCSAIALVTYDTHADDLAGTHLANYLASLPVYSVVMCVTADEPTSKLSSDAVTALRFLGVDVSGVGDGGKMAFVTQVFNTKNTVFRKATKGGSPIKLDVTVECEGNKVTAIKEKTGDDEDEN